MRKRMNIQLGVAVFLTLSGLVLVFCGFWVAPTGEIHNSVLVAYGEDRSAGTDRQQRTGGLWRDQHVCRGSFRSGLYLSI